MIGYLIRWMDWRARRPHPSMFTDKATFRKYFAIWQSQKPRFR